MGQTVIGFFKDGDDAQKAISRLETKGLSRQHVDISRGEYKDGTADPDGRNTNKVTDFFNKLFGHDSNDAKRYSTIGQSNVTIVTIHAPSSEMAEEAADILDDCGAVDVDEHAKDGGRTGGSDSDSIRSRGGNLESGNIVGDKMGTVPTTGGKSRRNSQIIDLSVDEDHRLRGDR